MTEPHRLEKERLSAEYARRDANDYLHRTYSHVNPGFQFHLQEREWAVLQILRKSRFQFEGAQVLEVGCGNGHVLHRFLEFGCVSAFGIDLQKNRIQDGLLRYPCLRLTIADAANLPFAAETFDLVSQFMCLSSVHDGSMRHSIADEMWRVLRPGGILLCYDLRPATFARRLIAKLLALTRSQRQSDPTPETGPDLSQISYQAHPTPIVPLTVEEMKSWWRYGIIETEVVSLDFDYVWMAERSKLMTEMLGRLSSLRSHYLTIVRKSTSESNPYLGSAENWSNQR
jgi:ubiquinone/menaquinone biosynthesis C-methylase UbiE